MVRLLIVDGVGGSWLVVVGVEGPYLGLGIVGLGLPSSLLSSSHLPATVTVLSFFSLFESLV